MVEMNSIRLTEGSSDVATVIMPKSEATLTFVTKLDNRMLDEWWVSHIENGEKTKVRIVLQPVIEIAGKEFRFTLAERESVLMTNADIRPGLRLSAEVQKKDHDARGGSGSHLLMQGLSRKRHRRLER